MKLKQISLFLENNKGQLEEITQILSDNNIDLKAINISETTDYGVLKLITDEPDKALNILIDNGYIVSVNSVVAVAVPNRPGGLNELLQLVSEENINIEYMYSVFGPGNGKAYMVLKVNDPDKLIDKINAKDGFETAGIDDLKAN